jgi:uncharacterized protein YegP (UPF0339 family)
MPEHDSQAGSCAAAWVQVVVPGDNGDAKGETVAGKFVLKKGSTGKFHFNLQAANGQVIATSEAYESKSAAMNGIDSVKKNAPDAEVDDQTAG